MRLTSLGLLLVLMPARDATAQIAEEVTAAVALRSTTIGALMPLMSPSMISRELDGVQFTIRYGIRERENIEIQTYAVGLVIALGLKASAALTGAWVDPDCEPCVSRGTVGLSGDRRLVEWSEVVGSGSALSVAASGEFAWAQVPSDAQAIAFAVGAPITLTLAGSGTDAIHFVSFLNPLFGMGRLDGCPDVAVICDEGGTRGLIGGGVGFWNPTTNISASIGVNQIIQEREKPVYGLTVIFGGRRPSGSRGSSRIRLPAPPGVRGSAPPAR